MSEADIEKARLLKILENHGRTFLNSFPTSSSDSRKRKIVEGISTNKRPRKAQSCVDAEEEEEWLGISKDFISERYSEGDEQGDQFESSDFEHTDEEFIAEIAESNVVVFSEPGPKKSTYVDHVSKAQMKAFMSSKISKLTSDSGGPPGTKKVSKGEEEDRTNVQNDALLHKLVHTKLLSCSSNTELDLSPAKRRKALAGRLLELAGEAKLGKGVRLVHEAEKNKAAKRVREGIAHKQKERAKQELEEAKNLGNYHPTLKKVFEASGSGPSTRKREKGLKMGIGKFTNGSLKLSRDDVKSVVGGAKEMSSTRGKGRVRSKVRGRDRGKAKKRT